MPYVKRHAEEALLRLAKMFGAVLVTGPRQAGKTTLLRRMTKEKARYVTLDDPFSLLSAVEESASFFRDFPPPVLVDEVQKAPELFPLIKFRIDQAGGKGLFWLTGSQQFATMKNIGESLAGRLGILTLLGLSMREQTFCETLTPFVPTDAYFDERRKNLPEVDGGRVWQMIHRGGMPELCIRPDLDAQTFYSAWVRSYLSRDVRDLTRVESAVKFLRFMTLTAARTGQLLNLRSAAYDTGISRSTAERWLSVLRATNLVYLLPPYPAGPTTRAVKTPKLFFLDTGLAAYLTRWSTPDALKNGAMAGAFLETFVVSEISKSFLNRGISTPPLCFYRDKEERKIDLLIEEAGTLFPVAVRKDEDPSARDIGDFSVLDKLPGVKRGPGGVVCLADRLAVLHGNDKVIPVRYL